MLAVDIRVSHSPTAQRSFMGTAIAAALRRCTNMMSCDVKGKKCSVGSGPVALTCHGGHGEES